MDQITIIIYKRGNTCGQKLNSDTSQAKAVAIFGKKNHVFLEKMANKCGFVDWSKLCRSPPTIGSHFRSTKRTIGI